MDNEKRDEVPENTIHDTDTETAPAPAAEPAPTETDQIRYSDDDHCVFVKKGQISDTPPVSAETLPLVQGTSSRKFLTKLRRYRPLLPIFALVCGLSWFLTLTFSFDGDIGHIRHGSVWFVLFCAALAGGGVLTLLLSLYGRRTRQYRLPAPSSKEIFLAFFAAALFGIRFLQDLHGIVTTAPLPGTLTILAAVTMIFPALYFLCAGLGKKNAAVTIFAMGSVVHVMLTMFRDYFDFTLPLNSPTRNMTTLALAALLLFFLAECRCRVDLWYADMPFTLFAAGMTILFAGSMGAGQTISACVTGHFSLMEQVEYVIIAAIAFCRLLDIPGCIGDHMPPPPAKEDIAHAEKKNKARSAADPET